MSSSTRIKEVAYSLHKNNDMRKEYGRLSRETATKMIEERKYLEYSLEAQQILASISDERSTKILTYVTSIINKALMEIFQGSSRRISLENKLHANKYPHVNVMLTVENEVTRDLKLQTGTGLRQIVSFLYRICLLEVTGGRKLIIMDELLSGVHQDAMVVIEDMMKIFADEGYQFLIVDYSIRRKLGKVYEVRNEGGKAQILELEES